MSLVRNGIISSTDQRVDQKKWDENYERIFGVWKPRGSSGKLRKREDRTLAIEDRGSSISKIVSDKVLYRHFRNGVNPIADKRLVRDVTMIERENMNARKQKWLHTKQQQLHKARIELRKSGGYSENRP